MKIKGTCRRCGREFLAEQVIEAGGECPWDGKPLQPDYAVVMVDALRDAEAAGTSLETALEKLADLGPAFAVEQASILEGIRASLARLEAHGGA